MTEEDRAVLEEIARIGESAVNPAQRAFDAERLLYHYGEKLLAVADLANASLNAAPGPDREDLDALLRHIAPAGMPNPNWEELPVAQRFAISLQMFRADWELSQEELAAELDLPVEVVARLEEL